MTEPTPTTLTDAIKARVEALRTAEQHVAELKAEIAVAKLTLRAALRKPKAARAKIVKQPGTRRRRRGLPKEAPAPEAAAG